jgi:hypothetical protein
VKVSLIVTGVLLSDGTSSDNSMVVHCHWENEASGCLVCLPLPGSGQQQVLAV